MYYIHSLYNHLYTVVPLAAAVAEYGCVSIDACRTRVCARARVLANHRSTTVLSEENRRRSSSVKSSRDRSAHKRACTNAHYKRLRRTATGCGRGEGIRRCALVGSGRRVIENARAHGHPQIVRVAPDASSPGPP